MAAHERALALSVETRQRLTIGISDHVAGPELPALIARMNAQDPELLIEIRIGSSGDLLQSYDRRELDTVIARLHAGRDDGTVLAEEQLGWFAAPHWQHRADEPLPLATLAEPCGVRALAAGGWTSRRCRGARSSSAAAWRRSRRPSWPGWAWPRWRPACCRSAPSTSALGCDCPRCRACRCCCTRAPGRPPPAGARRAVGGVPGRDTRLIRPHPGRAPYPLPPQSWRRPGLHSRFRRNTPQRFIHEHRYAQDPTLRFRQRKPCAPRPPNA